MKELLNKLQNPSKEYRAIPFWSWNDKLEPEMLKWQIREMDKAGLGGYFMHARGGLQTEYMSEEWMECTRACIEEGNKLGMKSWCYDEEGWPSGFAGGIVTAMGDKFHVRWLEFEEVTHKNNISIVNALGIYTLDRKNKKLSMVALDDLTGTELNDKKIIIIRQKSNQYYIDILNKEVVKAFIEVTHEKYYETFKDEFGKGMPGFFTDEPQISREHIPWSYVLPEEFQKQYGYDIFGMLPALFVECEGYEKFRYDFWGLVSKLYVESFGKQIYDWCEKHNCQLTGHTIQEDNFLAQMQCSAGVMPFYKYMHIPGIDWLGRRIDSPVIPKQVSSVANQLGKKFVLTESFALCGWDVGFEELKWIAEWQYVNGVNLTCQHLEGYSLRGLRKRDYPPSLFYQQSWWEEYKSFNDYFARLGMLLTEGRNVTDVLLIHPLKSCWMVYDNANNDNINKLDKDFVRATGTLAGIHFDHHYGDETIIGKHGRVEGKKFIVGQCEYKVVVLPSMISIDESTLKLLEEFVMNGGNVVSIGGLPYLCSGMPSEKLQKFVEKVICIEEDPCKLHSTLGQILNQNVSITDKNGEICDVHYQQRDLGSTQAFFVVNHSQAVTYEARIALFGTGNVKRYVAESGSVEEVNCAHENGCTTLELKFLPMQSYVLLFDQGSCDEVNKAGTEKNIFIKPSREWTAEEMDLNALTLDYCSYSIDGSEWVGPVHTIKLMDILLNLKKRCYISLKFNFEMDMNLSKNKEMYLAVEAAEGYEICLNGERIIYQDIGWWKDSSFKKVSIKGLVKNGVNEVILTREFYQSQKVYDVLFGKDVLETEINKLTYDVELESIYLIGDFGVKSKSAYAYGERKAVLTEGPFVVTDAPVKFVCGDLTQQGLCFFAGKVRLQQTFNINKKNNCKVLLDIGKPDAIISRVYINGNLIKTLAWAPYIIDISNAVVEGENKLSMELFAGNRNLLGPHHHSDGELHFVGPASFTEKAGWEGEFGTEIWADRYCFVRFGLKE